MQKENKGLNKKFISLFICFVLAFTLWLHVINVEDPAISRWVTGVPITFTGEAELNANGLAVAYISSEKVDVKLSAQRSRFKYLTQDSVSASLDLTKITKTGENEFEVNINAPDFNIDGKRKSSVKIVVEEYVKNKVFSINTIIEKDPGNGYYVESRNIDGKDLQIYVSGAQSLIEKVAAVNTGKINLSSIADNVLKTTTLLPVDENGKTVDGVVLSFDGTNPIEDINISFVIYKTATLPVEIAYMQGCDSPKLEAVCTTDTVTVSGPAAVVDKLTSIKTQAINEFNYKAGKTAVVQLSIPDLITLQDEESSTVTIEFNKN